MSFHNTGLLWGEFRNHGCIPDKCQMGKSTHALTIWLMVDTIPLQHDWCSAQSNRYWRGIVPLRRQSGNSTLKLVKLFKMISVSSNMDGTHWSQWIKSIMSEHAVIQQFCIGNISISRPKLMQCPYGSLVNCERHLRLPTICLIFAHYTRIVFDIISNCQWKSMPEYKKIIILSNIVT